LYDFLEVYEKSGGKEGFIDINSRKKSKGRRKNKNKSLTKSKIVSPKVKDDEKLFKLRLQLPGELTQPTLKASFSPVVSSETQITAVRGKCNKTNVSSPKFLTRNQGGRTKSKTKTLKNSSGRIKNNSPRLEAIYGSPLMLPSIDKIIIPYRAINLKQKINSNHFK
jgi:hypothetical protein